MSGQVSDRTPNSWIELHGHIFYICSSILYGCARILQWSIPKSSKSSIAGKYERNRYKFKFPQAPASTTRAQPLSSGAMHDRVYGPICGSIHHYGAAFGRLQNSGGAALGGRLIVLDSSVVDAATYGTIYPIMHGTRT